MIQRVDLQADKLREVYFLLEKDSSAITNNPNAIIYITQQSPSFSNLGTRGLFFSTHPDPPTIAAQSHHRRESSHRRRPAHRRRRALHQ